MALVDDSGWGLGVLNTDTYSFAAGFFGTPNTGGLTDDPTGYIGPHILENLDHNITYDHDVSLILGAFSEIRAYAVAHRRQGETRPDHHFALDKFQEDRQHFAYVNASDTGLPRKGVLHVKLDQPDPQIWLPANLWEAASMPVLYVNAAFHTHETVAQVFWGIPGQDLGEDFSESRSVHFPVVPDGQFHTYAVDLAASPTYTGIIKGLRFDPSNGGFPGDYVEIASISYHRDDAARIPRVVVRP